ncbi:GroES-like protein [Lojkania enalia]|uniref:GroES-like protein n=1 Tax=Lojkania enalia TaxID=147567 RepID=A0A9P4NA68_9PLEO|nr:GroES-like protein [Didymosphaeria enalia]
MSDNISEFTFIAIFVFRGVKPLLGGHRALVLDSVEDGFSPKTWPTPEPVPGSAIVRVTASVVLSYFREIYNGQRQYPFPTPLVGGCSAIGRITAVGQDAAALQLGQLVYVDCVVRARDKPSELFLSTIHEGFSEGSKRLMKDVWHDGTLAEFVKVPLDNCIPLDEGRLCGSLGYSVLAMLYMSYLLVPYSGLQDIKLEPGETVAICPATGGYGGAGIQIAITMGARVISMGRNENELKRLKEHVKKSTPAANIKTVKITGDDDTDTLVLQKFGNIDAVLDISPPAAAKSTHLKSAIRALRHGGRCSLIGAVEDIMPGLTITGNNITLKGKFMYEREDMLQFVKMLGGMFPIGDNFVSTKVFGLAHWNEAFGEAARYTGIGKMVVLMP